MLLRAQLAEALRSWMEQNELTQTQAARKLGISQPRLSEITRGKVELLSLDYLVGLCAKAEIPVTGIQARRVPGDTSLKGFRGIPVFDHNSDVLRT